MKTLLFESLPFVAAMSLGILFTISIIDLARKKSLFEANGELKHHVEQVCSLGGIAIFSAFWIACCLFSDGLRMPSIAYLFAGSFILFLAGVRDDLVGMPALQRLAIQVGVASMMFFGGLKLTHLPGMTEALPSMASFFLTILVIGAVVNAFNFIDGINGLSGGLAILSSFTFAVLFHLAGVAQVATMAMALAGAAAGFLYFNFGKAKIFMGDSGSTFIGVMLSFLCIVYLSPAVQSQMPSSVSPAVLVAVLMVPMMDLVKVVLGRLVRGHSPFRGDLTHIHHLLLQRGLGAKQVCILLYAWNTIVVVLAFFLLPANFWLALGVLAVVGVMPYFVLNFAGRAIKEKNASTEAHYESRQLHLTDKSS